jgi:hypothetical protein
VSIKEVRYEIYEKNMIEDRKENKILKAMRKKKKQGFEEDGWFVETGG